MRKQGGIMLTQTVAGAAKKAKPKPKQQPKDEGNESATKKSNVYFKETAPDEVEQNLHDSITTQATAIDDESVADVV